MQLVLPLHLPQSMVCQYFKHNHIKLHNYVFVARRFPPLQPQNLHTETSEVMSTVIIEWERPVSEGNIVMYRITIQGTNYFEEESCTETECAHSITADGSEVMFNTHYNVEVTAINTCNLGSTPASITVIITVELNGELNCESQL